MDDVKLKLLEKESRTLTAKWKLPTSWSGTKELGQFHIPLAIATARDDVYTSFNIEGRPDLLKQFREIEDRSDVLVHILGCSVRFVPTGGIQVYLWVDDIRILQRTESTQWYRFIYFNLTLPKVKQEFEQSSELCKIHSKDIDIATDCTACNERNKKRLAMRNAQSYLDEATQFLQKT